MQVSDFHIGADWADGDPVAKLAAAIKSVRALRPQPDAVLVSGDLSDHATDAEYELVRELLAHRHPLERQPRPHPVERADHAAEVERCAHGAKNGADT